MAECALFDIDGVLVDIRRSYNQAIKKTVEFVLKQTTGINYRGLVTDRLILRFRQSGGFNNDTDTSYAIALSVMAKPQSVSKTRKFLFEVADNADDAGIVSVEKFLANYRIEKYKQILMYPASVKESYIGRVFDELFYGPTLFKKQNGLEPRYCKIKKPFIANDRIAVKKAVMKFLHEQFSGKLAIVSGRSRLAAEYSLSPVMEYFDLDACVFLEDEAREHAKPNPYAIRKAMRVMDAKSAVYSGDSAEDMMMARRAEKEAGFEIAFVGVYGLSPRPAETLRQFRKQGADAVTKSVNSLPLLLNKVAGV